MRRRLGPFLCSLALGLVAMGPAPAAGSAASTPVGCAGATTTTTAASATTTETIGSGEPPPADAPDGACWVDVEPYPFGSSGEAVNSSNCPFPQGTIEARRCYLTVTSMAFRAWNRGLAAAFSPSEPTPDPRGVWIFNGKRWYPSPGFPGSKECPGHTILWAGKLDYWLVGAPASSKKWANLCRYDGEHNVWESLPVPEATMARIESVNNQKEVVFLHGTITSGACFAWNDCSFLGAYGSVVYWNGHALSDASPDRLLSPLQGEYTAAVARQGPGGEWFGAAVGATSEEEKRGPLPTAGGAPPAQLFGSSGEAFSPLPFTPPTTPLPGDPHRTDLVGVDFNSAGQGWVAGNPAGLRLQERENFLPGEPSSSRATGLAPSPLVPVSESGSAPTCTGPPPERFSYAPPSVAGVEVSLWSSIAVLPNDEALAAGRFRHAETGLSQREVEDSGEPLIARAGCEGTSSVTRFTSAQGAPPDREGGVTAIAANADNDAWAATSRGELESQSGTVQNAFDEPPHTYRLTNGRPVEAPEGNDEEQVREVPTADAPIIVIEPPQPEPPPAPPVVVPSATTVTLPAAVYDVKAKVHETKRHGHTYLSLYVTFRLHRAVTIGAEALRRGHVVSVAKPRLFAGRTGVLILNLDRKHWPTKVSFIS